MTLFQAFLCGIVYFLGRSSLTIISYYTFYRPLVAGFLVGVILGDPVQGAIIGATINLMYIGFISAGGSMPSDIPLSGTLGTALAISANLGTNEALAIAVPVGLLGTMVYVGRMTFNVVFNRWTEKLIAAGEMKGIWWPTFILPQIFLYCITGLPCMIACYFGSQVISTILESVSFLLPVLFTLGGVLPALGIAITLKFIFNGENRVFLFLGFLLAAYTGLDMIGIGLIGLITALIYVQVSSRIAGE